MKLVLEGGGTRAAYAAGVLRALQREGVPFEAVVGASTGSVNAAYFAAGQMDVVVRIWTDVMPDQIISYRRLVTPWGKPGLDVDRMMDEVLQKGWSRLDVEAALSGTPALYVVATDVPTGAPVIVLPTREDLFEWLRASSALPVGYNRTVRIGERVLVDAGVAVSVPFDEPIATPTTGPTVVLLTRPMETQKPPPKLWQRLLLRTIVPRDISALTRDQHDRHNALMRRLEAAKAEGSVIVVDPPPAMTLSRLTRDRDRIAAGVAIGDEVGRGLAERLGRL